jgi:hypothetical protein
MTNQTKITSKGIEYTFTQLDNRFFKCYTSDTGYYIQNSYKDEKSFLAAIKRMKNN